MKKLINKILSFFKKKEVIVEAPKKTAVKTKKAKG